MASSQRKSIWINALPLIEGSGSPASQHLLELAGILAGSGALDVRLAGPGAPDFEVGRGLTWERMPLPGSEWQRVRFEQSWLPGAAARSDADLLLVSDDAVPLRADIPLAAIAAPRWNSDQSSLTGRIRKAMGQAGARGVPNLRIEDLPAPTRPERRSIALPPIVAGGFRPTGDQADRQILEQRALPQEYVLALGETLPDAKLLLASWTWVEASLGDMVPLVMFLTDPAHEGDLTQQAAQLDLRESLVLKPPARLSEVPVLMRAASALIHSGRTSTGQELRWAMACGLPVAAMQSVEAASILGDAAYLTEPGDARALGAACLTLLVEVDQVARPLRDKGLLRATRFHAPQASEAWVEALLELCESRP